MDFIYRQHPTTDESPPWAGIAFKLPIDSDMLAEKLRSVYPERRTLRERKHQATIDFFVGELNQMQSKESPTITTAKPFGSVFSVQPQHTTTVFSPTVLSHSRPQTASGCTSPSLEETSGSPRPIEYLKPIASLPPSTSFQPATTTSATSSSQFVWNAHDGRTARPKTKRKMTIEERSAYKETRKRGACNRCRKQKGKCTHMVEGDDQTSLDESKSVKRKMSGTAEPSNTDNLKTVKTEHSSDVYHPAFTQPLEHRSSFSVPASAHQTEAAIQPDSHLATQRWEGEPRSEASAEEYVSTNLSPDIPLEPYGVPSHPEPWPGYSFQNYTDSTAAGLVMRPVVDPFGSPSVQMEIASSGYIFQSGYVSHRPQFWGGNLNNVDDGPGPT